MSRARAKKKLGLGLVGMLSYNPPVSKELL
jgi:hypothetical protein